MRRIAAKHLTAVVSVAASLGFIGAFSADKPSEPTPGPSANSPGPVVAASSPSTNGSDAEAILTQSFVGIEKLGGGYGRLNRDLSNSFAVTPKDVASVTVAFTCTGGATVILRATLNSRGVASPSANHICDGSVLQESVELPKPGAVGFTADVKGSTDGSFAYAYNVEKKQLK